MGRLTISGGRLGGRRISAPRGRAVRPSAARVREATFARLGSVAGLHVLDLFAGSGALGFEALSRGAATVTFVERSRRAASIVGDNARALGVEEQCRVVVRDWRAALRAEAAAGHTYGLCLIDPPYSVMGRIADALADALPAVLDPGALVVVEASSGEPPALVGLAADARDDRMYGDTAVSVIRAKRAV